MVPLDGNASSAHATVSVNNLGALDLLQAAVSGLKPGQKYTLWLVESRTAPFGQKEGLVAFQANLAGARVTQTIGPFHKILASANEVAVQQRFLLLTPADSDGPTLVSAKIEISIDALPHDDPAADPDPCGSRTGIRKRRYDSTAPLISVAGKRNCYKWRNINVLR
jgi:hypothetical protein